MKRILLFFLILITIILTYNYINNPFISLTILDNKISPKTKTIEVDCSKIIDTKEQMINYKLKPLYKDSKISVTSTNYNKENQINNNDISYILININVTKNKYIYNINIICKCKEE